MKFKKGDKVIIKTENATQDSYLCDSGRYDTEIRNSLCGKGLVTTICEEASSWLSESPFLGDTRYSVEEYNGWLFPSSLIKPYKSLRKRRRNVT